MPVSPTFPEFPGLWCYDVGARVYYEYGGGTMVARWGDLNRYLAFASLLVGIVTAALDRTFGGFAPVHWFLLAIFAFLIVICTEVVQLRLFFESRQEK